MPSLQPIAGVLGFRRAAHLLRRCSYRYRKHQVDHLAAMTVQEAISTLLQATPLQLEQPIFGPGAVTWINPPSAPGTPLPAEDFVLRRYVMAWWVHEALHDTGARHKIMFFLHQYLAVTAESGSSAQFFDYLSLLRWGIDQSFRVLVAKMVTDNCMLNYINNNLNFVNNPNENFAREFLELHTIGKGDIAGPGDYSTYTETDIVQAARVLTGFGNAQRHLNTDPDTASLRERLTRKAMIFNPKHSARDSTERSSSPLPTTQPVCGPNWMLLLIWYLHRKLRRAIFAEGYTDIMLKARFRKR